MLCCVSRKAAGAGGGSAEEAAAIARCRASAELSRFVDACRELGKGPRARRDDSQFEQGDGLSRLDEAVLDVARLASSFAPRAAAVVPCYQQHIGNLDTLAEEDAAGELDASVELQPCGVCSRKFKPASLEKHERICERTAAKKRKPFDSAKQRIAGTELAEFLPKQQQQHHQPHSHQHSHQQHRNASEQHFTPTAQRRASSQAAHQEDSRPLPVRRPAWKQTHDDFLKAIRAARGEPTGPSHPRQAHSSLSSLGSSNGSSQTSSSHHQQHQSQQSAQPRPSTLSLLNCSPGAPQRSNEKGQCPTCQRHFGLKSYDRHVAFCRERATRLPSSPQANYTVAKERLDARMKYRAPALRNRNKPIVTNRDKYSPGHKNAANASSSAPASSHANTGRMAGATVSANGHYNGHKETARNGIAGSNGSCESPLGSPKLPLLKRTIQTHKESPVSNNGPLKSRPIDRSNRPNESQDSPRSSAVTSATAPPAPPSLKHMFSSRRLQLLSEVLPSKILQQAKVLVSASSSTPKSSRSVKIELKAEETTTAAPLPVEALILNKLKKKKKQVKIKDPPCHEEETKQEIGDKDELLTWRRLSETGVSLEAEDEPALSCISSLDGRDLLDEGRTAASSCSRGSSGTADNRSQSPNKRDSGFVDAPSNRTYDVDEMSTSGQGDEPVSRPVSVDEKPRRDREQEEEDASSASTKTLGPCDSKVDLEMGREARDAGPNEDGLEGGEEMTHSTSDLGEMRVTRSVEPMPMLPAKKSLSMPNISPVRQGASTPRILDERIHMRSTNARDKRSAGDHRDRSPDSQEDVTPRAVESPKREKTSPSQHQQQQQIRRCSTYTIDSSNHHRGQLQQHRHIGDGDSRKIVNFPSIPSPGPKRNQQQRVVFEARDLYMSKNATSVSDLSSARTDDPRILNLLDEEDDYPEDNESNASELLREIGDAESESFPYGMRLVDRKLLPRNHHQHRATKSRAKRRCETALTEMDEETSASTIELTERSERAPRIQYEKQICTITRLDRVDGDAEGGYLPSICSRDRGKQHEYRVEKLFRSASKGFGSRGGIVELETPREEDSCDTGDVKASKHRRKLTEMRSGSSKEYNPFLLAEQQFNELFSDTLSDRSSTCTSDGSSSLCPSQKQQQPNQPPSPSLSSCSSHATPTFLPNPISNGHHNPPTPPQPPPRQPTTTLTTVNGDSTSNTINNNHSKSQQKRGSVIAPPTGFDDLNSSEVSSDVDTAAFVIQGGYSRAQLGRRRILVDASQALGGGEFAPRTPNATSANSTLGVSKQLTPMVERKMSSSSSSGGSSGSEAVPSARLAGGTYGGSLSSLASDPELKQSHSLFDELLLGFESDCTLPSLLNGLTPETNNCASFVISSSSSCSSRLMPNNGFASHQRRNNGKGSNGGMRSGLGASDDDFGDDDDEEAEPSSPDSLKRPKCNNKLSADSAYSSLNRKHSITHGRSANDVSGSKCNKLSKFCHECGFRFPDSAKFCCQCGVRRLSI